MLHFIVIRSILMSILCINVNFPLAGCFSVILNARLRLIIHVNSVLLLLLHLNPEGSRLSNYSLRRQPVLLLVSPRNNV